MLAAIGSGPKRHLDKGGEQQEKASRLQDNKICVPRERTVMIPISV